MLRMLCLTAAMTMPISAWAQSNVPYPNSYGNGSGQPAYGGRLFWPEMLANQVANRRGGPVLNGAQRARQMHESQRRQRSRQSYNYHGYSGGYVTPDTIVLPAPFVQLANGQRVPTWYLPSSDSVRPVMTYRRRTGQ